MIRCDIRGVIVLKSILQSHIKNYRKEGGCVWVFLYGVKFVSIIFVKMRRGVFWFACMFDIRKLKNPICNLHVDFYNYRCVFVNEMLFVKTAFVKWDSKFLAFHIFFVKVAQIGLGSTSNSPAHKLCNPVYATMVFTYWILYWWDSKVSSPSHSFSKAGSCPPGRDICGTRKYFPSFKVYGRTSFCVSSQMTAKCQRAIPLV